MNGQRGHVYILHFERPYQHARHYVGWAKYLDARLTHHRRGTSRVPLMDALYQAGIGFVVAVTMPGTRHDERRLKNRHNTPQLCPVCNPNNAGVVRSSRKEG